MISPVLPPAHSNLLMCAPPLTLPSLSGEPYLHSLETPWGFDVEPLRPPFYPSPFLDVSLEYLKTLFTLEPKPHAGLGLR